MQNNDIKKKNNEVIYIYGTQGSGKSLLAICLGLEFGKIYGRPLKVTNIGFFDSQFFRHNKTRTSIRYFYR